MVWEGGEMVWGRHENVLEKARRARAPEACVRGLGYILYTIALARTRRDQATVPIENRFTVVA